jgi:5'-3' exonuclease
LEAALHQNSSTTVVLVDQTAQVEALQALERPRAILLTRRTTTSEETTHETIEAHFRRLIAYHNTQVDEEKKFEVGEITVDDKAKAVEFDASSYRDTLSALNNDLIDYYGGYLRVRKVGDKHYLDYLKKYPRKSTQGIRFRVNLVELSKNESGEELFTILLPLGKEELTISSVNNGSMYLEKPELVAKYGRIVKTESFSDIESAQELLAEAQKFMNDNCKDIPDTLTVTALDIHDVNSSVDYILLGDTVDVYSPTQGIDKEFTVTSIEHQIWDPEKTKYTLTDPEQETKRKRKTSNNSSASDSAANNEAASSDAAAQNNYFQRVSSDQIDWNKELVEIATQNFRVIADDLAGHKSVFQVKTNEISMETAALRKRENDTLELLSYAGIREGVDENGNPYVKMLATKEELDETKALEDDTRHRLERAGVDVSGELNQVRMFAYSKSMRDKDGKEIDVWDYLNDLDFLNDGTNAKYDNILTAAGVLVDGGGETGTPSVNIVATKKNVDDTFSLAGIYSGVDANGNPHVNQIAKKEVVEETQRALLEAGVFNEVRPDGTVVAEQVARKRYVEEQVDEATGKVTNITTRLLEAGVFNSVDPETGAISTSLVARDSKVNNIVNGLTEAGVFPSIDANGNPQITYRLVNNGNIVSSINQTMEGVKINASMVDLGEYAKVGRLEAAEAAINRINANYVTTTSLEASTAALKAAYAKLINTDAIFCKGIAIDGMPFARHCHTMSFAANAGKVTLTLGAPTAADQTADFNIADTKFYKDAVASAANSMGVLIDGEYVKVGQSATKSLQVSCGIGGLSFNASTHKCSTYYYATVGGKIVKKVEGHVFSSTTPYDTGKQDGAAGVSLAKENMNAVVTFNSSSGNYTVTVTCTLSNGETQTKGFIVTPTEARAQGWAEYYNSGSWSKPSYGTSGYARIPSSSYKQGYENWFRVTAYVSGNFQGGGDFLALAEALVDGTAVASDRRTFS